MNPSESRKRFWIIAASLLVLFLGAMDALVISTAMPSIVADLGGLHLYSWVYAIFLLARSVTLPIFGKLSDLFGNRRLFLQSIALFVAASIAAGMATTMPVMIVARLFQGIGAGGIFALVYIILAEIAAPGQRAKTLSLASSVWGIASVIGPTLGGVVVSYISWRWIFFLNVPLGMVSFAGIFFFFDELRAKRPAVQLDLMGVGTLTTIILALLILFLLAGRQFEWASWQSGMLVLLCLSATTVFVSVEKRAADPILPLAFFRQKAFSLGNGAVFFSSFAVFALFAYAPLFIQSVLQRNPMQIGMAMLSLSLGWSLGAFILGQAANRLGTRYAPLAGGLVLAGGCAVTIGFSAATSMTACFLIFQVIGLGMGFVTLSTLLAVQNAVGDRDLGVATTSHQFARTLGGTVGVGVSGGVLTSGLMRMLGPLKSAGIAGYLPEGAQKLSSDQLDVLFQETFQAGLPAGLLKTLQEAVAANLSVVFWIIFGSAVVSLALCFCLSRFRSYKRL